MKKIISILIKRNITISVAESCTGGMLSSKFTSISGSSKIFKMGLVTYSNESKINILKIPKKTIEKYGAVSVQCCLAMVNNLSKISKSKINIAITGIAGPKGGTRNKPVGLVYIGLKTGKIIKINKFIFKKKGRIPIQKATTEKAIKLIGDFL